MLITKRSIATSIVLSIITCGIYFIYWQYKVLDDLYKANNLQSTALTDVVLGIITCGVFDIYLAYKMGKMMSSAYAVYGFPYKDESTLYLILAICNYFTGFMYFIIYSIVQDELNNRISDAANAAFHEAVNANNGGNGNDRPNY